MTRSNAALGASAISEAQVLANSLRASGTEPSLPRFRQLQWTALFLAAIWLIIALIMSRQVINTSITSELTKQAETAQSEARFIAQIVDKGLKTAEQLSLALAQDANTLRLTQLMNGRVSELKTMSFAKRQRFLAEHTLSQKVNNIFTRVANDVELMSVFALDASGYCIASSYFAMPGNDAAGCLGSNYTSRSYYQGAKNVGQGHQFAVGKRIPIPSLFFASSSKIDNAFAGAVVTRLDARSLTHDLLDRPSTSWVVDNAGVVISSNRANLLFNQMLQPRYTPPDTLALKTVYAQQTLSPIPLHQDQSVPSNWPVWQLSGVAMVLANAPIASRNFQIWHALPVEDVLDKYQYGWFLAIAIILLGLLVILLTERMVDFHQRRVAGLAALSRANRSLEHATKQLYTLATTDHLTQLHTRGFFMESLENELRRAHHNKTPLALMELDIDNFKTINDTYGHPAGDAAIRHMADHCRNAVRTSDLVGRIGGEEFAIALPNCNETYAMEIAETIRESCATLPLEYQGHVIKFTCSIGVTLLSDKSNIEELLNIADQALYRAKNAGRNRAELMG